MQLAFIPLYIKFLGVAGFGLIGFYATLQAALQVLDFGISPTMNRELARYSALPEKASEARDFVRTLEMGYWAIGLAIGGAIFAAAPLIAEYWIKSDAISAIVIEQVVRLMAGVAALQWPLSFYQGGLMGLQRQTLLNSIKIPISTASNGGAALLLWLVSPTVTTFFAWQAVASALQVALLAIFLWRSLPTSERAPRFNQYLLRNIWRFAAGMSGITLSALILTQLDKVILSKLLSLEMFGYYTLAGVVSTGLSGLLIGPIFSALFPRFSALVAVGDRETLKGLYHRGTQLMATLILPVAAMLALFSEDILSLWTGNANAVLYASPIVSLLVIGTALNGLMNLPYALQLAHGWTSIGLYITSFLIITLVPAMIFMTKIYGVVGAASVWVVLNSLYMLVGVPLTHRRLLKGEMWRWFFEDVCQSLAAALLVVGVGRWLIVSPMQPIVAFASLSTVLFCSIAAAALAAPQIRAWLLMKFLKKRSSCG
jgi:O-antigen/teichoic acid export membrane protein